MLNLMALIRPKDAQQGQLAHRPVAPPLHRHWLSTFAGNLFSKHASFPQRAAGAYRVVTAALELAAWVALGVSLVVSRWGVPALPSLPAPPRGAEGAVVQRPETADVDRHAEAVRAPSVSRRGPRSDHRGDELTWRAGCRWPKLGRSRAWGGSGTWWRSRRPCRPETR